MKVLEIDAIVVAPTQEVALVIVMIVGIETTSQLLVIAKTKFIMPNLEINQGHALVAYKTPTQVKVIIFMMTNGIGDNTTIFLSILA